MKGKNMINHFSLSIILSVVILIGATTIKADQTKEQIAIQQAETWLSIVDNQQYEKSWYKAANFFKNAVSMKQWINSMNAYRKPLGKMIGRKLKSKQYMTSLPGAPDGEYVVIQFDTAFENKKEAIETITPMIDTDGTWRVSGYFIK
jgi:hypothetical protein